jgi:hypothetical protein
MRLRRFPSRLGGWDDFLPHLPEVEIQPERLRVKSPVMDIELKIRPQSKKEYKNDNH